MTEEQESLRDTITNAVEEVEARQEPVEEVVKDEVANAPEEPQEPVEPSKPEITPPASWSSTMKEKWNALPSELQADIVRREEEVHKGFTKLDEERNLGKSMKEVIMPYMPIIQAEGGEPVTAVRDLLNTAYVLRSGSPAQKAAIVQKVIEQYGVDMSFMHQEQDYADPNTAYLQQRIMQLEQSLNPDAIKQQLQDQFESDRIQSEVTAFAGDPKNVHFETVRGDMAALLGSGRSKDIQEAYDQACWANPQIRSMLLAEQSKQEAKRKSDEVNAKRKAGVSVTGSPGANIPNAGSPQRSLREEIEASYLAVTSS